MQAVLDFINKHHYDIFIPLTALAVLRIIVCRAQLKKIASLREKKGAYHAVGGNYTEIGAWLGTLPGFVLALAAPKLWYAGLVLAVIGGSAIGMTSLVFYVLVYMAANLAVFGIISTVEQHSGGKVALADYNGFYRTNPKLALMMTLALFSLAGIPPFAGFFSKFFVFAAAFKGGFHLLVFIALVNTVVSLYYYLLVVKARYITPNEEPIAPLRSDRYTRLSLALCMTGVLLLGVFSVVYDSINVFSFGL